MDFDKIKQNILNSSETSTSESESISGSELHEEFEINNFLPEFEPLKLSGKNLAQQYVSAFNTGMNVYQCLNYLQGYVYTLVTAMNETIEAWNTVVPLLEQATKEWTDEEFDYKWSILKPQVIELVTNLTIETFNKAWEELKPVVIKLAQDTTDAEFKKQWDILKPQVITLVEETTTNKFNEEWEKLKPTIIQLSTDTTIAQFNRSWEELKPKVIELSQTTTSNKFDEKWEGLRPQIIELAQTTTSNKFDEKWEALQPTLTETVNNLAKTQTTTTFNEKWEELKPQVIELAQTTTNTKFDEKWTELQPTLNTTVENLVNTNLETFKSTLWQEVTKNNDFPFLLPENFGAVGDGVTDDSTAFNACITKANETYKYILLQAKVYFIQNKLINISNTKFIGFNSVILVNNLLCNNIEHCSFSDIKFTQQSISKNQTTMLTSDCIESDFKNCSFDNFTYLFNRIDTSTISNMILLDSCYLNNTSISNQHVNTNRFVINNTSFYYDDEFNNNFLIGLLGGTIIFNSCNIINSKNKNAFIKLYGNIIFNNCVIYLDNSNMIMIPNDIDITNINIEFNNCGIYDKSIEKTATLVNTQLVSSVLPTLKVRNTSISIKTIFNSDVECSLWLENNIMDTKPIINSGTGKVNIVEIQQKDNPENENIYPWISEIPTVENNVKLDKNGITEDYYVLTESKNKYIKKLDYYFRYNQVYTKGAPYYNTSFIIREVDMSGYSLKTSMLKNNIFKLTDSSGELIDYVYLYLDNTTITDNMLGGTHNTQIAVKLIPAVTKFTGKEEASGYLDFNACITLILEKTSS